MKKYNVGLFVGRFQPFHKGHLYLLRKSLEVCETMVLVVGSANVKDENNPFSVEDRITLLNRVIARERLKNIVKKIISVDDYHNDKKWLTAIEKQVSFDVVIGNNDWTNRIMRTAGYPVIEYPYYKRYILEGVKIRKLILSGGKWERRVPVYILPLLKRVRYF